MRSSTHIDLFDIELYNYTGGKTHEERNAVGLQVLRDVWDSFTSEVINFVHRNIRTSNKTICP